MTRQALIRAAALISAALALAALCALPGHSDEAHVTGALGGQQGILESLDPGQRLEFTVRFQGKKPAAVAVYAYSYTGLFWPTLLEVADARGRLVLFQNDSALPLRAFLPRKTGAYLIRVTNPMPFPLAVICWTN